MIDTINIAVTATSNSRLSQVDFNNIPFGKVYADHMFMADFKGGEWTDYQILPYQNLSISPANSAIHYGQSVFEGMKAYKNAKDEVLVFRPYDNLKRINKSADRMCIPQIPSDLFMGGMTELLRLDRAWVPKKAGTSLYIRPFVFATDEYIGIRPSDTYKFMIFTCPVGAYYSEPVKVKIETEHARAIEGGTGYAKAAGNYAAALYPAKIAQQQGYHQLIWTDAKSHEYIEESGTMNVMFMIGDTLITAPAGETILKGVTRDSVLTLAREWGIQVEERKVAVKEVINALKNDTLKEAFGTGTAATIANIATIGYDGKDYQLPQTGETSFTAKVLRELEGIKSGNLSDPFNWVHKI